MEPWSAELAEGNIGAAWDLFIERYHRLILATIRHMIRDDECVHDAFADVCEALSVNGLARLKQYRSDDPRGARVSTWLVTVVHNLVIDWLRHRDGRIRVIGPASLSPVQRSIFKHVFVDGHSHVEAYELIHSALAEELSFGSFLKQVADTYRAVKGDREHSHYVFRAGPPPWQPIEIDVEQHLATAEIRRPLTKALESLPSEERAAVLLYVVVGLSAKDVARILRWPDAKAVYNRVYRALAKLRVVIERLGVGPTDL